MSVALDDCGSPLNTEVPLDPGIRWECGRCTACCRWPGDVRLDDAEIARIARFLGMAEDEFIERFTRLRMDRRGLSLIEHPDHRCIMLEGNECLIHAVKPDQCRGFPGRWRFPGWREICEARPVSVNSGLRTTDCTDYTEVE